MFAELFESTLQAICPSELQPVFPKNKTIFLHKHSAIIQVRGFNIVTILNSLYLEFIIVPMMPFIANLNFGSRSRPHVAFGCPGSANLEPSLGRSLSL